MKMFAPNVFVVGDTIFKDAKDADGSPNPPVLSERYEAEVMALHDKIEASPFGAAWLEIVGNNIEPIVIVPMVDARDAVAQTFRNDAQKPHRTADAAVAGFPNSDGVPGTGCGTPIRLKFNPAAFVGVGYGKVGGAVLLVHEMTHGYRSAGGRFEPVPMAGLIDLQRQLRTPDIAVRFPDWEEWFAIVCENVFAAETGGHILRANWDVKHEASINDPAIRKYSGMGPVDECRDFAADYRPAIARMFQIEPKIYAAIRRSNAWFNPAREYESLLLDRRK